MLEMETPSPARVIMSMLGHVAIGVAAARLVTPAGKPSHVLRTRMVVLTALALLPDVDFLIEAVAPSASPFAHRGASHSFAIAMVVGASIAVAIRLRGGRRAVAWGLLATAVVASHGVLDLLGESDLGVALLWPMSDARFLATWHFLPNPPWPGVLSAYGLSELALEFAVFLPFWLYAFLPRRLFVPRVQS
jgi:inner membrane protein